MTWEEPLLETHLERLRYKDVPHEPFFITFSGVPFSGKSTLAKQLEERFEAVRVETDTIRDLMDRWNEARVDAYLQYFLEHYDAPNRRLILDASIDRRHPMIRSWCDERDIPLFLIRLPIPDDLPERVKGRGESWENVRERMKGWKRDYRKAGEKLSFDVTFESVKETAREELFRALEDRLKG